MTLLRVSNIIKTFAGVPVLQDISWQIEAGRKIGLVGANGSGKSTLLNLLSGVMSADRGAIETARQVRLGYLTQEMAAEGDRTLYDEVWRGVPPPAGHAGGNGPPGNAHGAPAGQRRRHATLRGR